MNCAQKFVGATVGALLASLLFAGGAAAQDPIKVKMGRIAFPTYVTVMVDVIKEAGLDRKNGIDLEIVPFGAISAYYGAVASGEVETLGIGTHVLQKMRTEGVPIKVILTYVRYAGPWVVTADPAIKSIADLKGRSLAAAIGSSGYQVLAIYGRTQGVVFGKDVTVVQADPPLARAQIQAKRVDAIMTWEPSLTLTLRDNPQYRVILNGETAMKGAAKSEGWEFVVGAREEFLRRQPQAVPRLLKMFQDGNRLLQSNPEEADRIVQRTARMPEGVLKEAVTARRMVYEFHPAWEGERSVIWNMFKLAVDWGYLEKLPDDGVIYAP
jgi:ABC-type nitrate/sulfonate/bicarbonate transport system substrate-binding protein